MANAEARAIRRGSEIAEQARAIWSRHSLLIRFVLMTGLLAVVAARVDLRGFLLELRGAAAFPLIVAGGLAYLGWVVNSYKWQILLAGAGLRCRFGELFHLNLVAQCYNLALPGQVTGEVLKAIRLSRQVDRRGVVYGSVMLDRLTGLAGLAILGWLGLLLGPRPEAGSLRFGASIIGTLAVLGGSLGILVLPKIAWSPAWLPAIWPESRAISFLAHWRGLLIARLGLDQSYRDIAITVALGTLFQAIVVALNWFIALSLGVSVSPLAIAWVMFAVSLLQVLPISIAGVGVRELTFVSLLAAYGVAGHQALAMAELSFGSQILLGLTGWVLDLASKRRAASPAEDEIEPPAPLRPVLEPPSGLPREAGELSGG